MSFPNLMQFHGSNDPDYETVYTRKKKQDYTNEMLASAASIAALRLLEDHMARIKGLPKGSNRSAFRDLLVGYAAAEIVKIFEEDSLEDSYDLEEMKKLAAAQAIRNYDATYGKDPTGIDALLDFQYQYGTYFAESATPGGSRSVEVVVSVVLLWSFFAILACCPFPIIVAWPLDSFGITVNFSLFASLLYLMFYFLVDPIFGSAASVFVIANLVSADLFSVLNLMINELYIATGIHVVSWVLLFVIVKEFKNSVSATSFHALQGKLPFSFCL
ncbi:UNVERIFIED_CONTAM: hypothetical protein HDU68_001142 [Siphonaria sp. JEL0065]|nr:hypothetical protein HDU68_001142 [Siphonaria sp. JEL0065]